MGGERWIERDEVHHVPGAEAIDQVAERAGENQRHGRVTNAATLDLRSQHGQNDEQRERRHAQHQGQAELVRQRPKYAERGAFVLGETQRERSENDGLRPQQERRRQIFRELVEEEAGAREHDRSAAVDEGREGAQLTNSFICRMGMSTAKTMIEITMPIPTIISGSSRLVSIEMRLST